MTSWSRSHWTRATLVAVLLTVVHTWPLATSPSTLSLNDNGDAMLNEWIVAWVQHQLPRHPLHLFQGNIFYPSHDALAFSEPLIVPALLGAPVRIAGGSPVLVHNILLLLGMTSTMLGMYALAREFTGDELASLVAGAAFAFNAQTLTRLAHLQAMHAYGVPLSLLAADRIITGRRLRDALWLALWMAVMAYTSGYLVVLAVVLIATALVVRIREWAPSARQVLALFAVAALVAAVVIAPLYMPFRRVASEQHMVRTLENVSDYSANLRAYAAPDGFFPGYVVAVLALLAVAAVTLGSQPHQMRGRIAMLAAIALVGIVMSLGTHTPVYGWLYSVFPPLRGIRVAARFGNLFLFSAAALAGIALSQVRTRLRGIASTLAGVGVLALVTVEAVRAPFAFRTFDGIPGVYALLAREPGRVVLVEQPFYPPESVFLNAEYVLNSTAHWRPLMNGYSGYTPQPYRDFTRTFWFFPQSHAIEAMQKAGVTHVMVHPERFDEQSAEIIGICDADPRLEKVAVARGGLTLYRVRIPNP